MDIVGQAKASLQDGDIMCTTMQRIAQGRCGHEEDAVYAALKASGLPIDLKITRLDLGAGLPDFPCVKPWDLVEAVAARGGIQNILGFPWQSSYLRYIVCVCFFVGQGMEYRAPW